MRISVQEGVLGTGLEMESVIEAVITLSAILIMVTVPLVQKDVSYLI
jgi:hypothetical protein